MRLVIGNYNYSSWSMRAWLCLAESGAAFETVRLPLRTAEWQARIGELSPSGRVPVLHDGDLVAWDSLAIALHAAARLPNAPGWPAEPAAGAFARSAVAEMHSGFAAIRTELPMNLRLARSAMPPVSDACRAEIERVRLLWAEARERFGAGGPWLAGEFSLLDAWYAPVAMRFASYAVDPGEAGRAWMEALAARPSVAAWRGHAREETERLPEYDAAGEA